MPSWKDRTDLSPWTDSPGVLQGALVLHRSAWPQVAEPGPVLAQCHKITRELVFPEHFNKNTEDENSLNDHST